MWPLFMPSGPTIDFLEPDLPGIWLIKFLNRRWKLDDKPIIIDRRLM